MDSFCLSPLWDPDLTWNTVNPDFTTCFQQTILVWVPIGFYLLLLPAEIYQIHRAERKPITWNLHTSATLALISVLLLVSIVDVVRFFPYSNYGDLIGISQAEYVASALAIFLYLLFLVTTVYYKRRFLTSSGTRFFFLALLLLSSVITFRSVILKTLYQPVIVDAISVAVEAVRCPAIAALFFISCCPDSSIRRQNGSPKSMSPFLARSSFWWVTPLLYQGYKGLIKVNRLPKLDSQHTCAEVTPDFEAYWQKEVTNCQEKSASEGKEYKPNMKIVLLKYFGPVIAYAALIDAIGVLFVFGNPLFLNMIISYASEDVATWKGYLYAVGLFLSTAISTATLENSRNYYFVIGMQVKTALTSVIYKKCFKLSSETQNWSAGEIVNLMSVDTQRVTETCNYLYFMVEGLIQIVVPIYFLYTILGYAMLTGIGILIITIPLNLLLSSLMEKIQIACMDVKTKRVNLISEILNGIKILKLYGWEIPFRDQVLKLREEEKSYLRRNCYVSGAFFLLFVVGPYVVALGSFTTYLFLDETNILTPSVIFVSLALMNIMRIPMIDLPYCMSLIIQANVSLNRLNEFLQSNDLDPDNVIQGHDKEYPIKIEDGSFKWTKKDAFTLDNINFKAKKNNLVAVVGSVGCGKTSLLSAILGDMLKMRGSTIVSGEMAYVPQEAWIKYATIEENILFYESMDTKWYQEVIQACCLESDLEILPAGDQTEIGEKGINLSGGQKQRVSLARAVYSNADIYLMDDSLSAVDAHVGKSIFDNVIGPKGILQDKTRVLVTHGLHYLASCDYIYVLKDGLIVEHGTYDALLSKKDEFSKLIMENIQTNEEDVNSLSEEEQDKIQKFIEEAETLVQENSSNPSSGGYHHEPISPTKSRRESHISAFSMEGSMKVPEVFPDMDGKLIEDESVSTGATNRSVYLSYAKYCGAMFCIVIVLGFAIFHAAEVSANQWLSDWSEDSEDRSQITYRLTIYGVLGIIQVVGVVMAFYALAIGTSRASTRCHNLMLENIVRAPMSFFDTTPLGRILNRFARDINNIDLTFVQELQRVIFVYWKVIAAIVIISIGVPLFLLILIPIAMFYFVCLVLYLSTSRQLMRLESITRSPIYTLFSESVNGASSIRAFKKQKEFISDCYEKVDENQKCYFPYIVAQSWVSVSLQFLGAVIVFFTSIFVILQRDSLSSGTIGLVITYAISTVYSLYFGVRCVSIVETNVVSVERVLEFTKLKEEAEWVIPDNRPSESWPEKGKIVFNNYQVKYRDHLPLVLKGIDINIKPKEKIGIVGRTGAGKSSLTLCLFRILEAAGGSITIDGINISSIGLHDLRSKLTIIPQDPVLFYGTLRFNLDPFSSFSDDEVWKALEQAEMKNFVLTLKQGLQHQIQEGGENLSVGQRQLMCLVRALLRKTKILVLDEATAAIDVMTDSLIQETIRKEFSECTILTIAHRLNTIMDSDRVMVLDAGLIAEFEKPSKLLNQRDSIFYGMAKDAGLI